jgi:signal transduction histidine kinase
MAEPINDIQALSVLYDLALVIGSEVKLENLLTKTLQRLLYHTGFPAGLVCSTLADTTQPTPLLRDVRLETVVGNYQLLKRVGEILSVPATLVEPAPYLGEMPGLLTVFPARKPYRYCLRLPIPDFGTILLLNPEEPRSVLPLAELLQPIVSQLATAVAMCRCIRDRTVALEQANAELEAFAYSVSHDLRAPLRAIDGFSHILIEKYGPALDDGGRHRLDQVRANAARMARLIDDMLKFAHTSRREMTATTVDMGHLAGEIVDELRPTCAACGTRFEVGPLPAVQGDREMLRQVLVNLISNAVKFTNSKPEAVIEVGGAATADGAAFYVRDNGVGFDMAYVGKLFGVFERLHPQGEYEGTGIGLAIVKRVIARHGGRVWAEGSEGRGAVFHFFLPRARDRSCGGSYAGHTVRAP